MKGGIESHGWMEVTPEYDWGDESTEYCMAVCVRSASGSKQASFDMAMLHDKPIDDRDDSKKSFGVEDRDFSWSGYFGRALVVNFEPEFFSWAEDNVKFAFWDMADYYPIWRMSNNGGMGYEFCEQGDFNDGTTTPGCFEPMSDRQPHFTKVEIVENTAARVKVLWEYNNCNPDYITTNEEDGGVQRPITQEFFTWYPDGVGTRRLKFKPKLDPNINCFNELIEPEPIEGSLGRPSDILASGPALTITNLGNEVYNFHPGGSYNQAITSWDIIIMGVHFKNAPDAFLVISQGDNLDVYPGLKWDSPSFNGITWHNRDQDLSHWPVGRRPYDNNIVSESVAPFEPSHTCLGGYGYYGQPAIGFNTNMQTDPEDNRKFREWVWLIGACEPNNLDLIRSLTRTWLTPGTVAMLSNDSKFLGVNYDDRALEFENTGGNGVCNFTLTPGDGNITNPSFVIKGWGKPDRLAKVKINDTEVPSRSGLVGEDMVVWVKAEISSQAKIEIGEGAVSVQPKGKPVSRTFGLVLDVPGASRASALRIPLRAGIPSRLAVSVYTPGGRLVREIDLPVAPGAGRSRIGWDGRDMNGAPVRAGAYVVKVRAQGIDVALPMTLLN